MDICHYMWMIIVDVCTWMDIAPAQLPLLNWLSGRAGRQVGRISGAHSLQGRVEFRNQAGVLWQIGISALGLLLVLFDLSLAFDIFWSCVRFKLSSANTSLFCLASLRLPRLRPPLLRCVGAFPGSLLTLDIIGWHLLRLGLPQGSPGTCYVLDKGVEFLHVRFWNRLWEWKLNLKQSLIYGLHITELL